MSLKADSETNNITMTSETEGVVRNSGLKESGRVVVKQVRKAANVIPDSITQNKELLSFIKLLPENYNFEIFKTVHRVQKENVKNVALQFPEGLLMYAFVITDILRKFCKVDVIVLGDVTYGACCVDDFTAKKLGAEMLIHYGHSCLVPVNVTTIIVMYVFVEIYFDPTHLINCLKHLSRQYQEVIPTSENKICIQEDKKRISKIALLGTVQFISILHQVKQQLLQTSASTSSNSNDFKQNNESVDVKLDSSEEGFSTIVIPQAKPLSAGETLGCTAPIITDGSSNLKEGESGLDAMVFVCDGRFHLEAAMIRNPNLTAYKYDPYGKKLTIEKYDVNQMRTIRYNAIRQASDATTFGVILGTLGRQGSLDKFSHITKLLKSKNKKVIKFLMAELNPVKLNAIPVSEVQVWVQTSCPRLSIDWGAGFDRPLLTPYELDVLFEEAQWTDVYPMDFYEQKPKHK